MVVFARTSRWIAYPLGWLLLMLVPLMIDAFRAGITEPASSTDQFTIPSFVAIYEARRDGDSLAIDVTEKITANFPRRYTNHGIERRLPSSYRGESIRLSDFTVTDASGKRVTFTRRTDGSDIVLRIGSASTYVYGQVNYIIRYTIGNAMVQQGDRQEIYLDVNGTGWLQKFGRVQATLTVADDLAGGLLNEAACYYGPAGSTQRCEIGRSGNTFITQGVALGPRENLTFAVGFAQGTVAEAVPGASGSLGWIGVAAMPIGAALILALALFVRHRRLRSLLDRDDAEIRYTPPDDVQPILAADFLGLPERGAAAQLTQLVLDGHATITGDAPPIGTAPQPRDRLSRGERTAARELRVQLTDVEHIDAAVDDICEKLFGGGRSVGLGNVTAHDIAEASRMRHDLLMSSGLRKASWLGTSMFVVGYVTVIGFGWLQIGVGLNGLLWPFLGCGLLAVMLLVAAAHYYPTLGGLTDQGRALRDQLAGLHRFVTMAEADRIAWMQNAVDAPRVSGPDDGSLVKLYEPLLPYAIIFGAEDTWRQALGNLYDLVPEQKERPSEFPALALAAGWADSSQQYYSRRDDTHSFWDSRPAWGEGWVSGVGHGIGEAFDNWATSRNDDSGGGWGGGGSSWSGGSSSFSSGSSGGGSSGGGMGGGGGGGW